MTNYKAYRIIDGKSKYVKQGKCITRKETSQRHKYSSYGRFYLYDEFDILFISKETR